MSPRRSDLVHDRLRREILDGALAPGDAVPSERALAEELEVNRHAVREALKRLQQAGLVRISQGGATRVQDWRDAGGLDLLLDLVGADDIPPALVRSVLEMRASIGIDAARRCADRADEDTRERVRALARATAAAAGPGETDERYAELWRAIVAGSANLAYRLALNSLNAALEAHQEILDVVRPTDPATITALGDAVAGADASGAAGAARVLLEP
jgi:GntR family transcriptional regulator, transcriptional repressor for pyruvate dehydrogenase complex